MQIVYLAPIPLRDFKIINEQHIKDKSYKKFYWLMQLALKYRDDGHKVIIYSMQSDENYDKYLDNLELHAIKKYPNERIRWLNGFRHEAKIIAKEIKKKNYDIIHVNWSYEYCYAAMRAEKKRIVLTLHDWPDAIGEYLKGRYWKGRLWFSKCNIRRAMKRNVCFTGVSPYICNEVRKYGQEIALIPNWIEIPKDEVERKIDFFSQKELLFISVNNGFTEIKNVQNVMRIFTRITLYKKAHLKLYGADFEKNGMAYKWALEHGINIKDIDFMGEQAHESILEEMRRADIMLSCSREESFGLTYIEAMSQKCLVIGGEHSGAVPWVLDYGKAGILIDVDDVNGASDTILKVLNDEPKYLHDIIANGYNRVHTYYTLNRVAAAYVEQYEKVLRE